MKTEAEITEAIRLLERDAAREDLHPVDRELSRRWAQALRWALGKRSPILAGYLRQLNPPKARPR